MPPLTSSHGPALTFGFGLSGPSAPTRNTAKRQRSSSPIEAPPPPSTPGEASDDCVDARPKRLRGGIKNRSTTGTAAGSSKDVGKMLATLDKQSLLTVFSRLLQDDAQMADKILAIMPAPSLSTLETALDEHCHAIQALNAPDLRSEFAWGRLRHPVAEFVQTAMGFCSFITTGQGVHPTTIFASLCVLTNRAMRLCATLPNTPVNLSTTLFSPDAGNAIIVSREMGTPKAVLNAYQQAVASQVKLSALNPNGIVSQLLPTLLLRWAHFADAVALAVNEEGRMFGAETVSSWLHDVEQLAHVDSTTSADADVKASKHAMRIVLARLQDQIGWLTGKRGGSVGMDFQ